MLPCGSRGRRSPARPRGVEMLVAVAPVRERHVVVDADEVGVRVGPERVEVEEDVARAVGRVVPEVLRPVGGVADPRCPARVPRTSASRSRKAATPDSSPAPSRSVVSPRISEPIRKASTPPAARRDARSAGSCAAGPSRRTDHPADASRPSTRSRRAAPPNSAATWAPAAAVLSTLPAVPGGGWQVIRPRQGRPAGRAWRRSEYGSGRSLPAGTSIRMKG